MYKKILHLNFYDKGGGATAAVNRIIESLDYININSKLLVSQKFSNSRNVIGPTSNFDKLIWNYKSKIYRKLGFFFKTKNKNRHSIAFFNSNIFKKIKSIKPDIVHLHWINNEMISIEQIGKIKKPIVWTLHDMWPYCGAEHYTNDRRFIEGYTRNNKPDYEKGFDINKWVWLRKIKNWNKKFNIICTSKWQMKMASQSKLFKNQNIYLIHLPLNFELWKPIDKNEAKIKLNLNTKKKLLIFGVSDQLQNKRKGINFLIEGIKNLKYDKNEILLGLFGQNNFDLNNLKDLNLEIINFGKIENLEKLRLIYSAANLLIMPSIMESFGQIALESSACETASIAFDNTGVEDIIDHKITGYIAKYQSISDLSQGIEWCLNMNISNILGKSARINAAKKFSYSTIANQYKTVYDKINYNKE